jgi:ArsR family transcriptional regulator
MNEKKIIDILKTISHPARFKILRFLQKGPSCATLANKAIPISQPNLSQHLKLLKSVGLIDCRSIGTRRCYYICQPMLVSKLFDLLDSDYRECAKSDNEIINEMRLTRNPNFEK